MPCVSVLYIGIEAGNFPDNGGKFPALLLCIPFRCR